MSDTRTINEGTFRIVLAGDYVMPPSVLRRIRDMVNTARRDVDRVANLAGTTNSYHASYRACVEAYFHFPTDLGFAFAHSVQRLQQNLRQLRDGLWSRDLTLHSAVGQHEGMGDAAAYVMRNDYASLLWEAIATPNPSSPAGFYGDIYMRFDQLGANHVAAANLVHEASHRFLGARDWAYLPNYDMIAYIQQWTGLGIPVPYPPRSRNALKAWPVMTNDEALNNADSYGGFVSRFRIP